LKKKSKQQRTSANLKTGETAYEKMYQLYLTPQLSKNNLFGFNDKDDGLSSLIRDKQITRQEALERVYKEGEISEEVIKAIVNKLGFVFSDLKNSISHFR